MILLLRAAAVICLLIGLLVVLLAPWLGAALILLGAYCSITATSRATKAATAAQEAQVASDLAAARGIPTAPKSAKPPLRLV